MFRRRLANIGFSCQPFKSPIKPESLTVDQTIFSSAYLFASQERNKVHEGKLRWLKDKNTRNNRKKTSLVQRNQQKC